MRSRGETDDQGGPGRREEERKTSPITAEITASAGTECGRTLRPLASAAGDVTRNFERSICHFSSPPPTPPSPPLSLRAEMPQEQEK